MDIAALRAEQVATTGKVIRHDDFAFSQPGLIAGTDVGFEQVGEVTRAAIALLRFPSLELVEFQVVRVTTTMPYIPGFLSFREYPALLAAWDKLGHRPDLLLVDGHGISHPRRLGVASHFGLMVDNSHHLRSQAPLVRQIRAADGQGGATGVGVWRSKLRCNPLFISTGHRVGLTSALHWVQLCRCGRKRTFSRRNRVPGKFQINCAQVIIRYISAWKSGQRITFMASLCEHMYS